MHLPESFVVSPFHLAITLDLAELLSMSAIARNNCVPVSVVQSVLTQLPFPKPQHLPQTLCIDEFKNKIKVLKRICFGVHDFESFRKRILLSCGCVHWDTDTSKYAMTDIGKEGVLNG